MRSTLAVEKFFCAVDQATSPPTYRGFWTKQSMLAWIARGTRARCQFPAGHPTESEMAVMRGGTSVALVDGWGWPNGFNAGGVMYVHSQSTTLLVFDDS